MSLTVNAGTMMELMAARVEDAATYNVLSIGENKGVENYTLIPVDQEGFVVIENRFVL